MNRGLYIGATSLVMNQKKMDVVSNNLANINTNGFKKDILVTESFEEKLLRKKSLQPQMKHYSRDRVYIEEVGDNRFRARIVQLDDPTIGEADDFSKVNIVNSGDGFFRVRTPRGISHEKEIEFTIDDYNDQMNLVTFNNNYYSSRDSELDGKVIYSGNTINLNQEALDSITENMGRDELRDILLNNIFRPRYSNIGTISGGVKSKEIHTDFTQGHLIDTEGDLDIAILGDGFIAIEPNERDREKFQSLVGDGEFSLYTRSGSFSLDENNNLIDLTGRRVAGVGPINGSEVSIDEMGRIKVDGQDNGQLEIVSFPHTQDLRKYGEGNFIPALERDQDGNLNFIDLERQEFNGRVLQGHLEASNVDPVYSMVEMISLMRDFEANQKVIKIQDEMLEKASTELGRV